MHAGTISRNREINRLYRILDVFGCLQTASKLIKQTMMPLVERIIAFINPHLQLISEYFMPWHCIFGF